MSAYIIVLVLSFASFYFVTCVDPFPVSVDHVINPGHHLRTYDTSQYTRLCSYGIQSSAEVKKLCKRLETNRSTPAEIVRMEAESGCEEIQLRFPTTTIDEEGNYVNERRVANKIGICRHGSYGRNGICISSTVNKGDLLLWKRIPYTMLNTATGEAEERYYCLPYGSLDGKFPVALQETWSRNRLPPQDNTGASSSGPLRSAGSGQVSRARQGAHPYRR